MRNFLTLVVVAAILIVIVALFYKAERGRETVGDRVEILPGLVANFTKDEDAGEHYARMIKSFLRRKSAGESPKSVTDDERRWFMLGTSCRKCSVYPDQFPQIMPNAPMPEAYAAKDIAGIMAQKARRLWGGKHDREALDILRKIAVLGWHVEKEDECMMLSSVGINIQWVAYDYMARFYESRADAEKAEEYRGYIEARRKSLSSWRQVTTLKTWSDFERIKRISLTHDLSLWRKEACSSLTDAMVINNPQARAQALQVLRTVAQKDPDPEVRQFAAACIPYVDGTKKAPQAGDSGGGRR